MLVERRCLSLCVFLVSGIKELELGNMEGRAYNYDLHIAGRMAGVLADVLDGVGRHVEWYI